MSTPNTDPYGNEYRTPTPYVEQLRAEITRLTKELEASRQETAKARDKALEEAANYAERREAQWAEELKHMRDVTLNTGKGSAAKQIADGIRALKSNPESNTQGGEG